MEDLVGILEDYLKLEKIKQDKNYDSLSQSEKDEFRLLNDNDAKYYYEECHMEKENALKGDIIISFWTPYCRLLKLEANWTVSRNAKTIGTLEALLKQIKATWENNYTDKIRTINKNLEEFAKVYYSKGNYMLLPTRKMNPQRYRIAEDRIDITLYECFDKGTLAKFFNTDKDLNSWISKEKLEKMFENKKVSKENIKWLTKESKPKWISEMSADEIYEYINNSILLIKERNKEI